ncbi:MAG TPA: O-antigen ligase family protein [Fluviicoccus sp.]|nr:O-antigen ligase family protein [Fluviicoccus sp.]
MRQNVLFRAWRSDEAFATAFLLGLVTLVPTNGFGSGLLNLSLLWYFLGKATRPDLMRFLPWIASALVGLVLWSAFAFRPVAAFHDAWTALRGILLLFPALYVSRMSRDSLLQVAAALALLLLIGVVGLLGVSVFNHPPGAAWLDGNDGLDWYVNRNRLGVGLGMLFILVYALVLDLPRCGGRRLLGLGLLVILAAVVLNHSRGSLMGVLAAGAVMTAVMLPRLAAIGLILTLAVLGVLSQNPASLESLVLHSGSFLNGRAEIWQAVWERVQQAPWTGYGLRAMPDDAVLQAAHPGFRFQHTHSLYLDILYASGIIGAVFWVVWYTTLAFRLTSAPSRGLPLLKVWGAGMLVYMLVHGLVDYSFYFMATTCYIGVGLTWFMVRPAARKKLG